MQDSSSGDLPILLYICIPSEMILPLAFRYNMLPSELGLQRTFETPPKRVQDTPRTIQQAPAVNRTELGQMTNLMMSLGMGDSPTNPEETDLVHNDALWMKEMMTV